jgi:hypothetical protein
MKTAYWDSGLRWDNPNLRWGSPSYLLEPGDPGYVPDSPPVNNETNKNKKHKKMKHNVYYPIRIADQIVWLTNFRNKLASHAGALGLTPAQVTAILADCDWLIYCLQAWLPAVRAWAQSCTDAIGETQSGVSTAAQLLPVFAPPQLPNGVVSVNFGVLTRLFALVTSIKGGGKCTDSIATDLGIVGTEQVGPDLTSVQPILAASISGNQVTVKWGWQGNVAYLDSCEIWVDRGDAKGFVLLTIDTTPGYTDTQPFPAGKAVWTYKAIYRVEDNQVGIWSQPVSINVGA